MTARPLVQRVEIDVARAQQQIDALERQLAVLDRPVSIPVDIESDQSITQLERDIARVDNQTVDVDVDVAGVDQADAEFSDLNRELDQTESELRQVEQAAERTGRELTEVGRTGTSTFRGLGASVVGFAGALAAFQGFQVLGRGIASAITNASELEQAIGGVESVFANASAVITDFGPEAAEAVGLTNQAFLQLSSILGGQLQAFGFGVGEAADETLRLIQVGADLAATYGGPVTDAVSAISSLLRGETNPIERYAVSINQAAIQAEALRLGLAGTAGELTLQQKAMAALSLLNQQTAAAQGQFGREAETTAGLLERLRAAAGNVSAELGDAMVPAFEELLRLAPAALDQLSQLAPVIASVAGAAADAAPSVSGFANALQAAGEIPGAFGNLGSILGGLGNVIAGPIQFLSDFEAGAARTNQGLEQLGQTFRDIDLAQFRNSLVDMLQAGVDPAVALGNVLVQLQQDLELDPSELEQVTQSFLAIANVDPGKARALAQAFGGIAAEGRLTAEELQAVQNALAGVFRQVELLTDPTTQRQIGGAFDFDVPELEASLLSEVEALDALSLVAGEAGLTIGELISNTEGLDPVLQALVGSLSSSTLQYLEQVTAIDSLSEAVGALPGSLAAAAAALRDEEGEIVEDFGTFFDNLQSELEARRAFESNLAILRALGLENLAGVFSEAGLEAAEALADAIANPDQAREAETAITGQYVGVGEAILGDISDAILGSTEVSTALIDNILNAALLADSPEVRAALLQLAEDLRLEIPATILAPDINAFTGFVLPTSAPVLTEGTTVGGTTNNVTNNFFTEPQPTTDTTRIDQSVRQIINSPT